MTGVLKLVCLNTIRSYRKGLPVRSLLYLIVLLSLAWSGYWFVASSGTKAGLVAWFDARQDEGWQAEYSDLAVRGFPNRVDASLTDVALADPETGLAWEAPFFQLLALSYKPNHVIAVWPDTQTLSTPQEKVQVLSDKMQASLVFAPETQLPLERSNFAAEDLALASDAGWSVQADVLRLALRRVEGADALYDFAYQAEGVAPPNFLRNSVLPAKMSAMDLDMQVGFDRPWDLRALEDRRPQPTSLNLRMAKAEWGNLSFQMAADLTIDSLGTPTGEATVRLNNWRDMITIARDSGQIGTVSIDAAEQFLALLASLSGSRDDVDVTLRFSGGTAFVGLIPVGAAPRLNLR